MKLFKEFKEFAVKGNMIDLAVGMIIGSAFTKLVSSLVSDIIMPAISLFTGKMDFNNWFYALDGKDYATLQEATDAGVATINYGTFISGIIDFIIMAFVVFLFVKAINKMRNSKKKEEAPKTTKICPYCQSEIHIKATKCPHCVSDVSEVTE